ncbi:hypothetical protein ACJ41O_003832 [Fusarium nematophilum]
MPLPSTPICSLYRAHCDQKTEDALRLGPPLEVHGALFFDANFTTNFDAFPVITTSSSKGTSALKTPSSSRNHNWPDFGPSIFLRLYTHLDGEHDGIQNVVAYVGQSKFSLWRRHMDHENAAQSGATLHYRLASKALSQHRYAIPLCHWKDSEVAELSEQFLELVEQTLVLAFSSYHPAVVQFDENKPGETPHTPANISHCTYLGEVSRKARRQSGWIPFREGMRYRGCNIMSPLFSFLRCATISCYRMHSGDPNVRTFTTYRTRATVYYIKDGLSIHLHYYNTDRKPTLFYFYIAPESFSYD